MHRRGLSLDKSTPGFSYGSTPPLGAPPPQKSSTTTTNTDDSHPHPHGTSPLTPSTTAGSISNRSSQQQQQYARNGGAGTGQRESYFPPTPPASIRMSGAVAAPIASLFSLGSGGGNNGSTTTGNQTTSGGKKGPVSGLRSRLTSFSLVGGGNSGNSGNGNGAFVPPQQLQIGSQQQQMMMMQQQQQQQRQRQTLQQYTPPLASAQFPSPPLPQRESTGPYADREREYHAAAAARRQQQQQQQQQQRSPSIANSSSTLTSPSSAGSTPTRTPPSSQLSSGWPDEGGGMRRSDSLNTVRTDRTSVIYDQDVDFGQLDDLMMVGGVGREAGADGLYGGYGGYEYGYDEDEDEEDEDGDGVMVNLDGGARGLGYTPSLFRRKRKELEGSGIATGESTLLGEVMYVDGRLVRVGGGGTMDTMLARSRPGSVHGGVPSIAEPERAAEGLGLAALEMKRSASSASVSSAQQQIRRKPSPVTPTFPLQPSSPPPSGPLPDLPVQPPTPPQQQTSRASSRAPSVRDGGSRPASPPRPQRPISPPQTPQQQQGAVAQAAAEVVRITAPTPIVTSSATPFSNPITNVASPFSAASPVPTHWGGGRLRMEISQVELPPPVSAARQQPALLASPTSAYADEKAKKRLDEDWEDAEEQAAEEDDNPPPPYVARMSTHLAGGFPDEKALLRRRSTLRRGGSVRRRTLGAVPAPAAVAEDANGDDDGEDGDEAGTLRPTLARPPATPHESAAEPADSGADTVSSAASNSIFPLAAAPARKRSILKRAPSLRKTSDGLVRSPTARAKIRFSHAAPEVITHVNYIPTTPKSGAHALGSPPHASSSKTPAKPEPCRQCNESTAFTAMYRDLLTRERQSFQIERQIWEEERRALDKRAADLEAKIKRLLERRGMDPNSMADEGTFGLGNTGHRGPGAAATTPPSTAGYSGYTDSYHDPRGKQKEQYQMMQQQQQQQSLYNSSQYHPRQQEPWYQDTYPGALKDTGKEVISWPVSSSSATSSTSSGSSSTNRGSASSTSSRPPATSEGSGSNKYWADFLDEFRLSSRCAAIPAGGGQGGEYWAEEEGAESVDPRARLKVTEERAVYARLYAEASIGIGGPAMELLQ